MAGVSGRFFNQTIDEKPAPHALDRTLGKRVWEISERLTGLAGLDEGRDLSGSKDFYPSLLGLEELT